MLIFYLLSESEGTASGLALAESLFLKLVEIDAIRAKSWTRRILSLNTNVGTVKTNA
jgi:hypothetical protein